MAISATTWSTAVSMTLSVPDPSLGTKANGAALTASGAASAAARRSLDSEELMAERAGAARESGRDSRENAVALDQRMLQRHRDMADDEREQQVGAGIVDANQERVRCRPVGSPWREHDAEEAHAVLAEVRAD